VTRPNVLVLLIDDLGWADLGSYGSSFYETPHIDQLAADGMRFTQFYSASSICSPTRASLMTGVHPARLQLTDWIGGEQVGELLPAQYVRELPKETRTLGEAFRDAGYSTGYIGKWHLGREGSMPGDHGFDYSAAVNFSGSPGSYFSPYQRANRNQAHADVPDLEDDAPDEYLTDRLTDLAVGFLTEHRDEPFFLILSHYAVHTPLQSKADLTHKYEIKRDALPEQVSSAYLPEGILGETRQRQDHPVYAGMVESTDDSVGAVLAALDDLGLAEDTIVVFVSDNGGLSTQSGPRPPQNTAATSNLPLRAGKGLLYEGGIRIPLIVRWPGNVEPGTTSDQMSMTTDIFPTLLEAIGEFPGDQNDGVSLIPVLSGAGALERDTLYWHFPHYHGSGNRPGGALRHGDLKLVEWFETDSVELFDLSQDLGETRNLAIDMPALADELRVVLYLWRQNLDAQMPSPNPDWIEGEER
jgi:arylsulfatase A